MKKFFILSFTLIILLAFSACSVKQNEPSKEPSDGNLTDIEESSSIEASENSQTNASEDTSLINSSVCVDYAEDELLADKNSYNEFIDDDSEFQVKAVFTASETVENFKYIELSCDFGENEDQELKFKVEKELYSIEKLSPEKPLVIGMAFIGEIPNRGISYSDKNGNTYYYTISMSGKDGSLLLDEFS